MTTPIYITGPDSDGLLWICVTAGGLQGAVSVRADSIAGRAFAAARSTRTCGVCRPCIEGRPGCEWGTLSAPRGEARDDERATCCAGKAGCPGGTVYVDPGILGCDVCGGRAVSRAPSGTTEVKP